MSAERLNSSGRIVLFSESVDTNSTSGNASSRVYSGSKASMLAQRSVELAFGASSTRLESEGDGNYKLTASYTFDIASGSNAEAPVDLHELDNSMSQVDVWTNPKLRATFLSVFGSHSAANSALDFVSHLVAENAGKSDSQAAAEAKISAKFAAGSGRDLILNAYRGVSGHQFKNSIEFNSVYRRRITAASFNQIQAAFTGAGKMWTTAEIIAFENVPSAWWFRLPSDYIWLKAMPIVASVAGQKTEIVYSYTQFFTAWGMIHTAHGSATLLNF